MAEHYSSQHDSVESVTSAYIAAALLAAGIVALSYALPVAVGTSLLAAAGVAVAVRRSSGRERGALLGALRRKAGLTSEPVPDCCPR